MVGEIFWELALLLQLTKRTAIFRSSKLASLQERLASNRRSSGINIVTVKYRESRLCLTMSQAIQNPFIEIHGKTIRIGLAHPTSKASGDHSIRRAHGRERLACEPPVNGLRIATAKCPTSHHARPTFPKMFMAHTRKKAGRESTTGSA